MQSGDKEKKTYIGKDGYARFKDSDIPYHRWVAKKYIYEKNRKAYPLPFSSYEVHHVDGNKTNNDYSNLVILPREEHQKIHIGNNLASKNQKPFFRVKNWKLIIGVIIVASLLFYFINSKNDGNKNPKIIDGIICGYDVYDCSDFETRLEARTAFEVCGGLANDIHYLDGNKDGEPCESLP
mgnify:FL=1